MGHLRNTFLISSHNWPNFSFATVPAKIFFNFSPLRILCVGENNYRSKLKHEKFMVCSICAFFGAVFQSSRYVFYYMSNKYRKQVNRTSYRQAFYWEFVNRWPEAWISYLIMMIKMWHIYLSDLSWGITGWSMV